MAATSRFRLTAPRLAMTDNYVTITSVFRHLRFVARNLTSDLVATSS